MTCGKAIPMQNGTYCVCIVEKGGGGCGERRVDIYKEPPQLEATAFVTDRVPFTLN